MQPRCTTDLGVGGRKRYLAFCSLYSRRIQWGSGFPFPLYLPQHPQEVHPLHKKLSLLAVLLSGDALQGFGLSPSASALIQESWRPGTRVQYDSLLRGWQGFCSQRKAHLLSPTIFDVISYLTSMYDRGLQYTTIASARSVLCPPYSWSYLNFFASSYHTAVEGNLSCTSPQTSV